MDRVRIPGILCVAAVAEKNSLVHNDGVAGVPYRSLVGPNERLVIFIMSAFRFPRVATFIFAAACWALPIPSVAQLGDRGGAEVQRPPSADIEIPPAPVLSTNEALQTFVLPPNFRIELIAAEPLVHDPVMITFDARGRMWVA